MKPAARQQHVVIAIPVLLIGGTEIQTLNLVGVLAQGGYAVTVFGYYEYDDVMVTAMEKAGAQVYLLKQNRTDGLWHLFMSLRAYFREKRPDIVHVQYMAPGLIPVLAAKLAGIKTIFATVHQPGRTYGLKARLFLCTAARLCTTFFCNSLAVEKSWFGSAALCRPGSTKVRRHYTIYNAVDTEAIAKAVSGADRTGLRLQLGLGDGPVVGIAARLRWEKGHALLLGAFPEVLRKFSGAKLLIVGDGPDRESLEQKAKSLGIADHVRWLGQKSSEEVYKLYSIMDIVVVPSLFEGFGLSAAEAMAAGLPVVATNVDGLTEVVVDNETGCLVTAGDIAALSKVLQNLLSDRTGAREMGRKGQVRVRELFSMEKFSQAILTAYRELA